jgi:putative ubiquitin-RnfH superfamily antitoxin RatB of RatAB toxin-antitoxin module
MAERIRVQLCHATPDSELLQDLEVEAGTTIEQAIAASGLFPDIDLQQTPVGIFGKKKEPATVLRAGDRIEIYRAMHPDPAETKRRRAAKRAARQARELVPTRP